MKDAITAHLAEFWKFYGRKHCQIGGVEPGVMVRFASGSPHPLTNGIFRPKSIYTEDIQDEIEFFKEQNLPFTWWLEKDKHSKLSDKLQQHGFSFEGNYLGVCLNLKDFQMDYETKIQVNEIEDDESFQEWMQIVKTAKTLFPIASVFESIPFSDPFRHFVAQKSLGALTLFMGRGIPGIWNLAICDEEVREEIEEALVYRAIVESKKLGFPLLVSFHTDETHWMKRFGFKTYLQFSAYAYEESE